MYEWQALSSDCSTRDDANCRRLWELAYAFAPQKSLKARLSRIKVLFALDKRDVACELVAELVVHEHLYSPHVLNNAGVCSLRAGNVQGARDFFVQAVHTATGNQEAFSKIPVKNLQVLDAWMSAFRAENGERTPTAEERGRVVFAVVW